METIEIKTESPSYTEDDYREFIRPFYVRTLNERDCLEIQQYISNLSDSDYKHNEFEHYDGFEEKQYDKYRSCEIHYPKDSSILSRVGKKYFQYLNNQFYRYDLKNLFEFQLIKYYVGGNYNWHCDYGVAPDRRFVRKLSMTMQLSPPDDYEGGELQLVDYGNHLVMMEKYLGRVLVFDSKVPHKVWPVTWGTRFALVGWASGPQLR